MRDIHLGLDLFVPENTPIYAPFDSIIHSFANKSNPLDYGPTIILEHSLNDHVFYTLYGHLSQKSLASLFKGKKIKKGEIFAWVGDMLNNGGWPPHLHFQLILDMLSKEGDFPGVAPKSKLDLWSSLCPDPNLILNIPLRVFSESEISKDAILSKRACILPKNLSISYEDPLVITRGSFQYLINENGVRYLDGVNNVAHVGHAHPDISHAIYSQAQILNTNTRYLSSDIILYANELLELFPKKFGVCFFTNSGSEANDLALRLARNFTKKTDIVCLDNAYHGNLTSLIEISPYKFKGNGGFPCPKSTHVAEMPDPVRGNISWNEAGEKYGEQVIRFL